MKGAGEVDCAEEPTLRLYGDVILKIGQSIAFGKITKMCNVIGRSKTNYVEPILMNNVKELYPNLIITVKLYNESEIITNAYISTSTEKVLSVKNVLCSCNLNYNTDSELYYIDEHLKTTLDNFKTQYSRPSVYVNQNVNLNAISSSNASDCGRVVTVCEPMPGARSQRIRKSVFYEAD